ncbi:MAG: transcription antitermination factor NusB [Firmicutes bacterium]|uniref:Transcription antitermination protein NusB n=1 Tax=Candidatus Gallilactobacillus intestinavium TaxID=2840838 RepID=A0A9D9H8N7_9LACO|nr:transcription antitermination factor NusB [Candidatus Gallilactobacillus intestinavium]
MKLNRHQIREIAFQVLFAKRINSDNDIHKLVNSILTDLHYDSDDIPNYLYQLIDGVITNTEELNKLISSNLAAKWNLERLKTSDLVILQLAIYEMKYEDTIPMMVSINEAIELAKEFSDDDSKKFINGLLSSVYKQL